MGLLDQIQQQVMGSLSQSNPQIANAINGLLQQNGGVEGLIGKFQQGQLKEVAQSWISTGTNLPISADQIKQVLGSEQIKAIADKVGISPETISQNLSEHLPNIIDKLTPNGKLPEAGGLLSSVLGMASNFLGKKN